MIQIIVPFWKIVLVLVLLFLPSVLTFIVAIIEWRLWTKVQRRISKGPLP